jgi:hypothetical protein
MIPATRRKPVNAARKHAICGKTSGEALAEYVHFGAFCSTSRSVIFETEPTSGSTNKVVRTRHQGTGNRAAAFCRSGVRISYDRLIEGAISAAKALNAQFRTP